MARAFNGSESITVAAGVLSGASYGALTVVAVVRPSALATMWPVALYSGASSTGIRFASGGTVSIATAGTVRTTSPTIPYATSDGWILVAVTKPAGTATARVHKYVYNTDTWTRADTGSTVADQSGTISTISLGHNNLANYFNGDIAAAATYQKALTDDQVATLAAARSAWLTYGPAALWVFDQGNVGNPILDWTGGGANQTGRSGTTVTADSAPIGYGHPVTLATTRSTAKHLFSSQTPSTTNAADGTPGITTATTVKFAQAGTVSGVRFFSTTTVSGVYAVALWSVDSSDPGTGTLLASKTLTSAPAAGTWNSINFDSPVSVNTSTLYRAGVFSGAGRYVATTNFTEFIGGAGGLTNGDIWAPHNGDSPVTGISIAQGTFEINAAITYPNDGGNASSYFVDVDFQPSGGGPVTHNADATLAATGALSGAATRDTSTTTTLAGTGALTGTAARSTSTTASLAGVGALAATAVRTQDTTATLAATGTLSGTAARTQATTGVLAATGALAATGITGADQTATLTGTGALSAVGDRTAVTTAVLAATGALAGTAAATRLDTATLAGLGALTAVGDVTTPGVETATLSGTGGLSATAVRTAVDTSLLAGVGALTGTVARATSAMATLAGLGALSATAIVVPPGDATTAPTSALRTTTRPTLLATVSRPLVLRTGTPPT